MKKRLEIMTQNMKRDKNQTLDNKCVRQIMMI